MYRSWLQNTPMVFGGGTKAGTYLNSCIPSTGVTKPDFFAEKSGDLYRLWYDLHNLDIHHEVATIKSIRFPIGSHPVQNQERRRWNRLLRGFRGLEEIVLLIPSTRIHKAIKISDSGKAMSDDFGNSWILRLDSVIPGHQTNLNSETYGQFRNLLINNFKNDSMSPSEITIKFEYVKTN